MLNVILAVSLNLVTGILGQLVLGHAGFMLVGAYAAANFTRAVVNNGDMSLQLALPIAMLIGGVFAALFGVVIGIPHCACAATIWRLLPLASGRSFGLWRMRNSSNPSPTAPWVSAASKPSAAGTRRPCLSMCS